MGKRNATETLEHSAATTPSTPQKRQKLQDAVHLNQSVTETPPQTYTLTKELVEDTVLLDLNLQKWRVGQPVGKGSFGEIFLASDDISRPVSDRNAKYVVKIEPHSNGPLFVEIHCLMNTAKDTEESPLPDGMPEYIASGSHLFRNEKYRFLILPRFQYDLHSVLKLHHKRLDPKNLLVVASQILDILQHLHDNGYVHSDIKAENLMVGNPADVRQRRQLLRDMVSAGTSASTSSISSASSTMTLATKASTVKMDDLMEGGGSAAAAAATTPSRKFPSVEFSGSNPVRRCRFNAAMSQETTQSYNEMVSSHYLRPLKQINYFDDSEASSDAFGGSRTGGGGRARGMPMPEVYNSNSNISMMSNGSNCSLASSSGISSIAQNTNSEAAATGRGSRRNQSATINGSKSAAAAAMKTNAKRGKKAAASRFRVISESNGEEEEDDEEDERDFRGGERLGRDRIYLIDFGLASKFVDTVGTHRPFFMDERRAHDGTLEFTSRDAHLGAHARRSDLECLGYNLICWSQGNLPWRNEKMLQQPEEVHHMKEFFMSNVKETLKLCYGPHVPKYLSVYMEYVNQLMYTDRPDYDYCRSIFRNEFKRLGYDQERDFHLDLEPLRRGGAESVAALFNVAVPQQQPAAKEAAVVAGGGRGRRRTGRRSAVATAAGIKEERGSDAVDKSASEVLDVTRTPQQCNEQLLAKFGLMVPSMRDSSSKISPKNLRSKKAAPKKKRRKLSWEELLATDPEQIARQRIEKEFDEQDSNLELSIKYQGKPTYAILELENKLNSTLTGGGGGGAEDNEAMDGEMNGSFFELSPIKGYTKPMMDIVRRRHSNLIRSLTDSRMGEEEEEEDDDEEEEEEEEENEDMDTTLTQAQQNGGGGGGMTAKKSPMMEKVVPITTAPPLNGTTPRRKAGLRPHVKQTSKSLFYHKNLLNKKLKLSDAKKQLRKSLSSTEEEEEEEEEDPVEKEDTRAASPSSEEEEEEEKEPLAVLRKHQGTKKRGSGGSGRGKKYEEDEDWNLNQAEPEINEVIEEEDDASEEEDDDAVTSGEEEEEQASDEEAEDSEEEEEGLSDSHTEESNSCDRDLGSKRNTRLTRWNGGGGAGNGRRVHNMGTSSRFTESGKGQRMITRG